MKTSTLALLITSTLCLMPLQRLHAWAAGGHKLASMVAYERLSPELRTKVAALLLKHPRYKDDFVPDQPPDFAKGSAEDQERWLFTQASIWPDKPRGYTKAGMKELRDQYHRGPWHYVNQPVFLNEASRKTMEAKVQVNLAETWTAGTDEQSMNATQMLDMAVKSLRDPAVSDERKALLLSWMMHVVGDLHQPMHCVALFADPQLPDLIEGDRGGNRLFWPDASMFHRMTLHAYWDLLLSSSMGMGQASDLAKNLMKLSANVAHAEEAVKQMQPMRWVEEGAALARSRAYTPEVLLQVPGKQPNTEGDIQIIQPGRAYHSTALELAKSQITVAGFRLARLIEKALR